MLTRLGAGRAAKAAGVARGVAAQALSVVNNVAKQQFTVSLNSAIATLDYEKDSKNIKFISTNVPQEFQGKGVGKLLAKNAFEFAARSQLKVLCQCHFLHKFYETNKDKYKGLQITFDLADE